MREAVGMLIVAGLLAFSSLPSRAQMVSPFGPLGLPLTQEDFSNMSAAVRPLLDDDSMPLGTTREWKNPTSGNSGRMTLIGRFETAYQGNKLPCRKIRYHIQIRNVADPYNLEVDRCRAADGSWKIL
jgi:surface antigen